jgi:hypothetical protein
MATMKKLAILKADRDALDTESRPAVRRSCQLGLTRLINQFEEETDGYRLGQHEKAFLRKVLKTPAEAANTASKLARLEELITATPRNTDDPAARASLSSLRRMRNEMKEQLLWFEAKERECVHSHTGKSARR